MSPLTHVHEVTTPTLLYHGEADRTCPLGQSQQWFTALRERGVPTQLVVYPGGSHGFIAVGPPSHRLDLYGRVVEWIEQYTLRGGRPVPDQRHWQDRLDRLAARHRVPGAQLGILLADGSVMQVSTGVLSVRTAAPVTDDAIFQLGSISKIYTATMIMQLCDEGLLTVDTRVLDVLPDFELADAAVTAQLTIRHLLTHTSGIDGDVFTDTGRGDDCLAKYAALLARRCAHPPVRRDVVVLQLRLQPAGASDRGAHRRHVGRSAAGEDRCPTRPHAHGDIGGGRAAVSARRRPHRIRGRAAPRAHLLDSSVDGARRCCHLQCGRSFSRSPVFILRTAGGRMALRYSARPPQRR